MRPYITGDGLIDYNEFVASTMHISKLEKEELLQKAFAQLDRDGSGTISVDELRHALKQFGVYDDAAQLLSIADKNGDVSAHRHTHSRTHTHTRTRTKSGECV